MVPPIHPALRLGLRFSGIQFKSAYSSTFQVGLVSILSTQSSSFSTHEDFAPIFYYSRRGITSKRPIFQRLGERDILDIVEGYQAGVEEEGQTNRSSGTES